MGGKFRRVDTRAEETTKHSQHAQTEPDTQRENIETPLQNHTHAQQQQRQRSKRGERSAHPKE